MSSEASATASVSLPAQSQHFMLRRLHSLTGIIPLGAFFVEHMVTNFAAVGADGAVKYNHAVQFLKSLPFVLGLEIFGIFLPLLFHGVLGMWIAFEGRVTATRYPLPRNWVYVGQRASGAIALVFVIFHLLHFRFASHTQPFEQIAYQEVARLLANPFWLVAYLIGTAATAFHLGNGIPLFCISWGITVSPRSQALMNRVGAAVGLGLFALGTASALSFKV